MSDTETRPREDLYRAARPGFEVRSAEEEGGLPTLFGHLIRWNEWTEIHDAFEGSFMERFAPGAFAKSISENRDSIKALFQHGHDPTIGDKPLGSISELEEDDVGARYEVDLLDTDYVREIVPGLEAGVYGASFRFHAMREEIDDSPERSERNPDGIQERTVKEAKLFEFSPVTFPAYAGSTAGVRSLSQHFNIFEQLGRDPGRTRELFFPTEKVEDAPDPAPRRRRSRRVSGRVRLERSATLTRKEKTWRLP